MKILEYGAGTGGIRDHVCCHASLTRRAHRSLAATHQKTVKLALDRTVMGCRRAGVAGSQGWTSTKTRNIDFEVMSRYDSGLRKFYTD